MTIDDPCLVTVQRPNWCPDIIYDVEPGFVPDWIQDLVNQEVTIGGENIVYNLGVPVNVYGQTMDVKI